ncbi:MAG: nitroreductase family protein [candidate division FCPU426 bacterium]
MPTHDSPAFNGALEAIKNRHSVRQFSEQPVSEADLTAVLEAANYAPSAHNQQAWRFIIVRGEKKRELVELINQRLGAFPRAASVLLRLAARTIASAPEVVAVANTGELIEHGTRLFQIDPDLGHDFFRTMEIQSSAAAVQNLLLAATSLGLATVWLGILYLIKDEVLTLLGEPQGEFMAIVPLGYPVRPTKGPVKRPLDSIVKVLA